MKREIKVLFVEDSDEDKINFERKIKKLNETSTVLSVSYKTQSSLKETMLILKQDSFDILLLDLSLPDTEGLNGLDKIIERFEDLLPVVVLTGHQSEEMALKAIQRGAQDYLLKKEITPYTLSRSIVSAIERIRVSKELEQVRIQQAKSLKMATLGEMAGGIAHEINNPLAIILGYADRIKRQSEEHDDLSEFRDYGNKITQVTKRIAKIVKNLKAYSRREDHDPVELVKLKDIIEDTLSLCSERFKTASIELTTQDIVDVELMCKDIQLSQVLLNLLNNAYDAVKNRSEKWVKIYSRLVDDKLNLYVVDSGEIVDEATRDKIFTPFFTTKAKGEGTGLGMSISKNIIEAHGGHIELIKTNKNTSFKISLPLKCKKSEEAA